MTARAHISQVQTAFKAAGKRLPEPVRTALDEAATVHRAELPGGGLDLIAAAVADAILSERDPIEDADVQRSVVVQALGGPVGDGLPRALERHTDGRIVEAVREHWDEILSDLVATASDAGQTLTKAHDVLGDVELDDEATIIRLGPDAVRRWADARDAVTTLRIIGQGWSALNHLVRFASDALPPTLRMSDADLDDIETLGKRADVWSLVRAGLTISLADATTARERQNKITEQRAARDADQYRARGSLLP